MPFDFDAVIHKEYEIQPVLRSLIASNGIAKPQILWVGCSDSLTSETFVLDVEQEELFVHRNLGNILSNGDLSSESAVAWAVDLLKVGCILQALIPLADIECSGRAHNCLRPLWMWSDKGGRSESSMWLV